MKAFLKSKLISGVRFDYMVTIPSSRLGINLKELLGFCKPNMVTGHLILELLNNSLISCAVNLLTVS